MTLCLLTDLALLPPLSLLLIIHLISIAHTRVLTDFTRAVHMTTAGTLVYAYGVEVRHNMIIIYYN